MKTLIVKTSSLGDILQTFNVASYLKNLSHTVDWVVEKRLAHLVHAHPDIDNVIEIDSKSWPKNLLNLRKTLQKKRYDYILDLQGNCKSGLVTLLAKAKQKIGFTLSDIPEWPNILASNRRFPRQKTYLQFVQSIFKSDIHPDPIQLKGAHPLDAPSNAIMICPGSNWSAKQLSLSIWDKILSTIDGPFIFIYGSPTEKTFTENLAQKHPATLLGNLDFATWQALMEKCRGIISVDSCALHLAATTSTPTFSIFGPSSPDFYKPEGEHHHHFFSTCPLSQTFEKRCPLLRTCSAPCTKNLNALALLSAIKTWDSSLQQIKSLV